MAATTPHKCGKCMNPHTRTGNPLCKNNPASPYWRPETRPSPLKHERPRDENIPDG